MKKMTMVLMLLAGCDFGFNDCGFGFNECAIVVEDTGIMWDDWQSQQLEDDGAVCLLTNREDPNGMQVFDATTPITVVYDANTCLSSSCSRNSEASVSAAVAGNTIAISSSASWERNMGNVDCTDDCGMLGDETDLGVLAEGSYTVTFGGESLTLTIPGEQAACFGELWY
ncbi:MAG: hypothetical protein AAFV53_32330 [Myxococcota bacterium]